MAKDFKVLWVDDDLKGSKGENDRAVLQTELKKSGLQAEVIVLTVSSEALFTVLEEDYEADCIVLDWFFEQATINSETVLKTLQRNAPATPVIIYSGRPEAGRGDDYENVRLRVEKPDFEELVAGITQCLASERPRILIFSDLHFGWSHGHGPGRTFETLRQSLEPELEGYLAAERPNLLIVAGDLSSCGESTEFREALVFINFVADALNLPPERILSVPGNHDIRLADQLSYNNYWERFVTPLHSESPVAQSAHLLDRDDPMQEIEQHELGWVSHHHSMDLTVVGLNSCEITRSPNLLIKGFDKGVLGSIRSPQLSQISRRLSTSESRNRIKICVLHHQLFALPTRAPTSSSLDESDRIISGQVLLMHWLAENGIPVVVHGHTHYPSARTVQTHYSGLSGTSTNQVHVISAGSLGAGYLPDSFGQHSYSLLTFTETKSSVGTLGMELRSRVLSRDAVSWHDAPHLAAKISLA